LRVPEEGARRFEPGPVLAALEAEGVRYVVIGGTAAVIRGAAYATFDLDITPARDVPNLDRLAMALRNLDAKVYGMPDEVAKSFRLDGKTLANGSAWKFVTSYCEVDVALDPDGTHGYEDLVRDAAIARVGGLEVPVASLADVVRSKEAANRDKDRIQLPLLRRVLEQSRRSES
jgi:hypothetical protein